MKINNLFFIESVAFSNLKVGVVVPRRNGHNAGAELRVDGLVLNNRGRYFAVDPLGLEGVAVLILGIALVVGMHDDVFIAELGLRPGGADLERPVLQGIKLPLLFFVNDFVVRHVSFEIRIPVDNAVTPVNQAVVVHLDEGFVDAAVQGVVQRVAQARPVGAGAHRPHLVKHGLAAIADKLPGSLQESFAADLVLISPLLGQFIFDDGVNRHSGVVGTGQPEHVFPLLAGVPGHNVLKGQEQGVADAQRACLIRRRHAD